MTCGAPLLGAYCHVCGEKRPGARDLTLRAFAHDAVEALTSVDGRLLRSLRALLLRPGLLTREFVVGRRRPYLGPLQLFLVANLSYFLLLQIGFGGSAFTTDLAFHGTQPIYGRLAEARIEERLGALPPHEQGTSVAQWVGSWNEEQQEYRRRFNEASPRYANSLVVLMVPLFALALRLLRGRGPFVRELVFSAHFFAFVMLLLVALPLLLLPLILVRVRLASALASEDVFGTLLVIAMTVYLTLGFRTAHGDRWPAAVLRGLFAPALLLGVITIYRMILFFVVFRAV